MFSSVNESNGFTPVTGDEMTTVNGGVIPAIIIAVASVLIVGCSMPTNPNDVNRNRK